MSQQKKKPTKAKLASELKKKGIPVPKSASVDDMQHRLDHWLPGDGFIVRLLRGTSRYGHHPVSLLPSKKETYWIPNSVMAEDMIASRILLVMDRTPEPIQDTIFFDVPSDYSERYGDGGHN
jgi:hypothetical protein